MPILWSDGKDSHLRPPWKGKNPKTLSRIHDGLSPSQLSGQVRPNPILSAPRIPAVANVDRQRAGRSGREPLAANRRPLPLQEPNDKNSNWVERLCRTCHEGEGTNRERVIIVGRAEPDESLGPTPWSEGFFERFWFPGSHQAPAGFLA
jgi:hypothetical protein